MLTNQLSVDIPMLNPQHSQIWQQILDLDTTFVSQRTGLLPSQRQLYLRRRTQLSRRPGSESENGNESRRADYLIIRREMLARKYNLRDFELANPQSSLPALHSTGSFNVLLDKYQRRSTSSFSSVSQAATLAQGVRKTGEEGSSYAFSGIEAIFDHHQGAITRLRFAHNDSKCLAVASADGSVSICHLATSSGEKTRLDWLRPPNTENQQGKLSGAAAMMDIAWSAANEFLVSVSLDGALHLWSSFDSGSDPPHHIRTLSSTQLAAGGLLACEFHPGNNNLLVIIGTKGSLVVVNLSMGRVVAFDQLHHPAVSPIRPQHSNHSSLGLSALLGGRGCLTALTFESAASTASCLWVGSDKGLIQAYQCSPTTGKLIRTRAIHLNSLSSSASNTKTPSKATNWFSSRKPSSVRDKIIVTSLVCRSWLSAADPSSYLLVNATGGLGLLLFHILSPDGQLSMKRRFDLPTPTAYYPFPLLLHACFAPLISFSPGSACVVSGSEGGRVLVFDVFASLPHPVTYLEGHQGAVVDVTLSWDEAVLASADVSGCVIIWRRQSNINNTNDNNN